MAVSFDLFGTLVEADRPADPAAAIARELEERGVPAPEGWADAYRSMHVDAPPTAEVPLPTHVAAALSSRGVDAPREVIARAVLDAFDRPVELLPGAADAVERAVDRGPVGICSNCSVPGLVGRTLTRSSLPLSGIDAVVTSVGCGYRKPDPRCFEAVAAGLGVHVAALTHVGDDPETDGGIADAGGEAVLAIDRTVAEALGARS